MSDSWGFTEIQKMLEYMTFIVIYSLRSPKGRESNVWLAKRWFPEC